MAVSQNEVEQFLYREARYLDDREFDKWLECYAPDAEFWMPCVGRRRHPGHRPDHRDLLIYYNNRGGLEDRVFRIKTDRSSATSLPEPRTSHNISNVEIVSQDSDVAEVRFNWFTLYYRYQNIDPYFGTSYYTVDFSGRSRRSSGRRSCSRTTTSTTSSTSTTCEADMTFQIALNFEDGVTRFIECKPNEVVADASYRQRINIPLDCRDGACGTCKSFCESGSYDGGDYIEDALTDEEADEGFVPHVPDGARVGPHPAHPGHLGRRQDQHRHPQRRGDPRRPGVRHGDRVRRQAGEPVGAGFLPGQYVNIQVPGTDQTRSFSFSSGPGRDEVEFLVRNTTHGVLTTYLRDRAQPGDRIEFNGPLGSFYLRELKRPAVFLAGGTGLAPFLSMLEKIEAAGGSEYPIHLIFGVTNDPDLVKTDVLDGFAERMENFTYACTVAAEESSYPNKGYVTHHLQPEHLNNGELDMYLCGPPPMVDAVRKHLADQGIQPNSFYYEKFAGSGVVTEIGEIHVKVPESNEAFDARMALELGAASMVCGKLTADQLAEYRRLADATATHISGNKFSDSAGFREANAAFHLFPVHATGNPTLVDAHRKLLVTEYMGEVLTLTTDLVGDITHDHREIVDAFEKGDFERLRAVMVEHNEHAKLTMKAGIEAAGSKA